MIRKHFFLGLVIILCLVFPFKGYSEAIPLKKKVLALYSLKDNGGDPFFTKIHTHLEVVFNHLGLEVEYHPIERPLLKAQNVSQQYIGVITWFNKNHFYKDAKTYCEWLHRILKSGGKIAILGEAGFLEPKSKIEAQSCVDFTRDFGVSIKGDESISPFEIDIVSLDKKYFNFERKLNTVDEPYYLRVNSLKSDNQLIVTLDRKDLKEAKSHPVILTPHGLLVAGNLALFRNLDLNRVQWRLNPFSVFAKLFNREGIPLPDTTTINGSRIFYSHIDGDGLVNVSKIDRKSFSGELIYERLLKKYVDIPITVSFVTAYFDMKEYQSERVRKMNYEIMTLENVEVASHGHVHPFKWGTGKVAFNLPGYRFDPKREIVGSLKEINDYMKKEGINKRAELFLWTGDCLPKKDALDVIREFDILNMNGGDSRFDREFNSYAYAYPLGLLKDGARQIYSSFPNENIYTNLWEGPFYGYSRLSESIHNLGTPIRVKPINIYYHYYSGERIASMEALYELYDYAIKLKPYPMFASDYVRLVRDFFASKLYKTEQGYRFENLGHLRTLRVDETDHYLDLERSTGVLGFLKEGRRLYVHLDDSLKHDIVLSQKKPLKPYLKKATMSIRSLQTNGREIEFEKKGWGRQEITFGNLKPGAKVKIQVDDKVKERRVDQNGDLFVNFDGYEGVSDYKRVLIRLESL